MWSSVRYLIRIAGLRRPLLWLRQRYRERTLRVGRTALLEPARREAARLRDADFAKRSSSYRAALGDGSDALLPESAATTVSVFGLTILVPQDARKPDSLSHRIVDQQWLPLDNILRVRKFCKGGIMLDVGANIGTTSIPRVVLGDFESIYAAEADPLNYACLVRNVRANGLAGRVLPDCVAISDHDGVASMRRAALMGNHRLLPSTHPHTSDVLEVPCLTLDSWIRSLAIDVDLVTFVKSDTQGFEWHVLRGARAILGQRHIAWQIEFSPRHLAKSGASASELCDELKTHFTDFIDLGSDAQTPRARPTSEIEGALAYVARLRRNHTDLLLFSSGGRESS